MQIEETKIICKYGTLFQWSSLYIDVYELKLQLPAVVSLPQPLWPLALLN